MSTNFEQPTDRQLFENIYQLQIVNFHRIQHLEKMMVQLGANIPELIYPELDDYHNTVNVIMTEIGTLAKIPVSFPIVENFDAHPKNPDLD